jgi:hypothetical protein
MADMLSTLSSGAATSEPVKSRSSRASQTPWQAALATAMYSTSQEESATTFCLEDCQVMGLLPRKKTMPVVLLRWSMLPARLASL